MEAMRLTCQVMVLAVLVVRFLVAVKWDIEGRPTIMRSGFRGVLKTLTLWVVIGVMFWFAGAFDRIF